MEETDIAGSEGIAQTGCVTQDSRKDGLEHKTEVHDRVAHSLVADGEPAGLADQQVSPLNNNDGNEVRALSMVECFLLAHAALKQQEIQH